MTELDTFKQMLMRLGAVFTSEEHDGNIEIGIEANDNNHEVVDGHSGFFTRFTFSDGQLKHIGIWE